jgi:hypothetical protein
MSKGVGRATAIDASLSPPPLASVVGRRRPVGGLAPGGCFVAGQGPG